MVQNENHESLMGTMMIVVVAVYSFILQKEKTVFVEGSKGDSVINSLRYFLFLSMECSLGHSFYVSCGQSSTGPRSLGNGKTIARYWACFYS